MFQRSQINSHWSVATKTEAIKPSELSQVIVDTTVQPKNVMFPSRRRSQATA
jgi:IS5 family transposase